MDENCLSNISYYLQHNITIITSFYDNKATKISESALNDKYLSHPISLAEIKKKRNCYASQHQLWKQSYREYYKQLFVIV